MDAPAAINQLLDAVGEGRARSILAELAGPAVLAEFDRAAALRLAMRMHAAQEPRPVIRDRLESRGLSRATAYRILGRAISVPPANCLSEGLAVRHEPTTVPPHFTLDLDLEHNQEPCTVTATTSSLSEERYRAEVGAALALEPSASSPSAPVNQPHRKTSLRVKVTHLKAPWPAGARIGSVVEIPFDAVPAIFAGKCEPVAEGTPATHVYEPPRPVVMDAGDPLGALDLDAPSGNVEALIARRDELHARLASIDIAAAEQRLEKAKRAKDANPSDMPPVAPPGVVPQLVERRIAGDKASVELKTAQGHLRQLREEAVAIGNEIAYLGSLIDAEARVDATRATAKQAEAHAASCKEGVSKAEAALQHIESLIEKEQRAYEIARDDAGARVLEAVKSGNADVPIEAASRDKVAALEVAQRGAESELQAARAVLEQAEKGRREAWQQVRLAEASVAERAFLQAEREYVEALSRVQVAKGLARLQFGATDPRGEALLRARKILEGLGL